MGMVVRVEMVLPNWEPVTTQLLRHRETGMLQTCLSSRFQREILHFKVATMEGTLKSCK